MSSVSSTPRSHRGFCILARGAVILLGPIFYFHFSIFDFISIPTLGDTHVLSSPTGPQVFVSFHLCRWPPMPHSPLPSRVSIGKTGEKSSPLTHLESTPTQYPQVLILNHLQKH